MLRGSCLKMGKAKIGKKAGKNRRKLFSSIETKVS